MKKNSILRCVGIMSVCATFFWGTPLESSTNFSLSHTEGKGLGYSQGYTTLGLVSALGSESFVPFVDLKGHVFNKGHFASNAGAGIRWLDSCSDQIWGVNFFYDTFFLKRLKGHQVSLGLEMLTDDWDFSINGYLPVGRKKTNIYTLSYDFTNGFLAKAKEQLALGGIDLEAGRHFCFTETLDLYGSAGPYFYWGRTKKTVNAFRAEDKKAYGGRLRVKAVYLGFFELEGQASYDSLFKWTGQATVSIDLFDLWNYFSQGDSSPFCGIQNKLSQPVRRNVMMVIDTVHRSSTNPLILDPEFEP